MTTEATIHLVTDSLPDVGQHCIVCGIVLVPRAENSWSVDGQGPRHFPAGLVLRDGAWTMPLDGEATEADFPTAVRCKAPEQSSDEEDEEDEEAW